MNRKAHWDSVYASKRPEEVSWYQAQPTRSLDLIAAAAPGLESSIIDVGGGDSTLVDGLLERGYHQLTVLDLSGAALARTRARLGPHAAGVTWLEADATRAALPSSAYDVWHDRAVFHFLTEEGDRVRYVAAAARAVRRSGTLVVATFAPDGPQRCSGLTVARYDAAGLERAFETEFLLERAFTDMHRTPAGSEQHFTYAVLRRR
jgi:SAM-dependent methyltransferase